MYACRTPHCTGRLQTDGKDYGLLRKTAKAAFGHEILYEYLDKLASGGISWYTSWRDLLNNWLNAGYVSMHSCVAV